jgi:hypothetical protein
MQICCFAIESCLRWSPGCAALAELLFRGQLAIPCGRLAHCLSLHLGRQAGADEAMKHDASAPVMRMLGPYAMQCMRPGSMQDGQVLINPHR